MVTAIFAAILTVQNGPATTPIYESKHGSTKPATSDKKPAPPLVIARDVVDKGGGWGEPVKAGDLVTVQFVVRRGSVNLADSKRRGLPYTFRVGAKGNDPLLDVVVRGMKVGITRTASVAAVAVYGAHGVPPLISGKDDLSVTINLIGKGAK
jgi:FK506-binding nuclear protein